MSTGFQFIDQSNLNDSARRRIRAHVATGKNVGRKLSRPSRRFKPVAAATSASSARSAAQKPLDSRPERSISSDESRAAMVSRYWKPPVRNDGDEFDLIGIPGLLRRYPAPVRRAVEFFATIKYFPEIRDAFEPCKSPPSIWIRLMYEDPAYFHVSVAASIASLNAVTNDKVDMSLAFEHVSSAIKLVNPRLGSDGAASDMNIAVVTVLAQFERSRNCFGEGLVHMDGLEKMIRLRGGIGTLMKEGPSLALKLVRLDLEYALNIGTSPRFTLDEIMFDHQASSWLCRELGDVPGTDSSALATLPGLDEHLALLAKDMTGFAWVINDAKAGRRRVPYFNIHIALLILQYRLLEIAPLSSSRITMGRLDHAVHIGLAAFVMPFMHALSGQLQDCPFVGSSLSDIIRTEEKSADTEESQGSQPIPIPPEFLLWLVFVLWTAMPDRSMYAWVLPTVSRLTRSLDLGTWEEVSGVLRKYPWVHPIHGKSGKALYDLTRDGDQRWEESPVIFLGLLP